MRRTLYALVDCSAFYCSCERAFRPDLIGKPICVLSNNDGCIISLTPDCKALGFQMGTPYYQVQKELREKGVTVFSSNYCLYADMSKRVTRVIKHYSAFVEQYSIDESFLQFTVETSNIEAERARLETIAKDIHTTVLRKTGIPVRVSIAETKTLAKVGSEYTKQLMKEGKLPTVCFWQHPEREAFMAQLPVRDVWGVGREWSKKLQAKGIHTAQDLAATHPKVLRQQFNIVMEKTVLELTGIPSISFEEEAPVRKSLVRSRMFAKKINDPTLIRQAIATHLARAAEKLRKDQLMATELSLFISTGTHADLANYCHARQTLLRPTNDTMVLEEVAHKLFNECYVPRNAYGKEYLYAKAGVALSGFISVSASAPALIDPGYTERPALMQTLDTLNKRFGKHTVVQGSMGNPTKLKKVEGAKKGAVAWGMKRELMSKRFTSVWDELLEVKL